MSAADPEMEEVECPVCHENYTEPKILPCAHLLCRDCLVSWMKTNPEGLCPLCRSRESYSQNSSSNVKLCEEFADSLPTDHSMSAKIDCLKILSQKRVCVVHTDCDAKSLCVHCSAMLCENCIEVHKILPALSHHIVEDLSTLTLKRIASLHEAPCCNHPDKPSELYCTTHNRLICQSCAISEHRACREIIYLDQLFEICKQSLVKFEVKLRESESSFTKDLAALEKILETTESDLGDKLKKIDKDCDRLLASVEACRNRLKKLVLCANENNKTVIKQRQSLLNKKRGIVTSHLSLLNRVLEASHHSTQIAMINIFEGRIKDLNLDAFNLSNKKPLTLSTMADPEKEINCLEDDLEKIGKLINKSVSIDQNLWQFHSNHGKNIILSNNNQTAEMRAAEAYRTVMSMEPLQANKIYEVLVEDINARYEARHIRIGVVTENPETVILPEFARCLSTTIAFSATDICVNTELTPSDYGHALSSVKVGSRVGVMIDEAQCLHLFVDGIDQGVAYRDVKQPCYAVIGLGTFYRKVTTIPLTHVQ